jgi:HTH-type transcriptional regulator/antitoxin HigA
VNVIRPGMPWLIGTSASIHALMCQVVGHWPAVEALLRVPENEQDYDLLVVGLVELKGIIGKQEAHPLSGLVAVIEVLMAHYERETKFRR